MQLSCRNFFNFYKVGSLLTLAILSACGAVKDFLGVNPKITSSQPKISVTEKTQDPAVFWLYVDAENCSPAEPNYTRTEYNKNDVVIAEHKCTYNSAVRTRIYTTKLIVNETNLKLEDRGYQELEYNSAGRPAKMTEWTSPDKKTIFIQKLFNYDASGKLTSVVETTEQSGYEPKNVITYTFDANENLLSRKTEYYDKDKITSVKDDSCYPRYLMEQARPCEIKVNDQVSLKVEINGPDTVWKSLINGTFVEVLRQSEFSIYGWAKETQKTYDENNGQIQVSSEISCTNTSSTTECSSSVKNGTGSEVFSSKRGEAVIGSFVTRVANQRIERALKAPTTATFTNKCETDRTVTGTATLITDPKNFLLESEYSVSVTMAPATNTATPDADIEMPDMITPIWPSDYKEGTITYKVKETENSANNTQEKKIYDINGIDLAKIPANVAIRVVTNLAK